MTIYDIAKLAGVSASTVSRVVNNKPGVNRETRLLVRKLLEENNYVSNDAARSLVTSSSKLVGILIADVRTQHHTEGAYHIANELKKLHYSCIIMNTGDSDESRANGLRVLEQRKVEAAVLMGSIFQTEVVKEAIRDYLPDTPVFMMNGYLDLPNVYGVLTDEKTGLEECVDLMTAKRRKKIAFMVDRPTPSSKLKLQGFLKGMERMPFEDKASWIYENVEGTIEGGRRTMKRLLEEHPEVDGVICSLDIIACGVIRALYEEGVSVPGQVAVIGVDNSVYAEICTPRLTSLDNMILDSAITITHKLIDCLEHKNGNHKTLLFTSVVEREST